MLIEQHSKLLFGTAYLMTRDRGLAEDAVQDTFIKIHKSYSNFNGDSREKTWIMRIAINVCKNYLRSSWWKCINETTVLDNIPSIDRDDALQDETLLVEIMKLSSKYKEVILLFYYQNMKIREIAEALNAPEATISVRLKRAREILKVRLKGWYYDE